MGRRLTTIAGAAVGLLLALEIVARLAGLDPGTAMLVTGANCLQRSALLGQEFRPSCVGTLAETKFRTNSLGWRGDEPRSDGSKRILALGDSSTWGWGVNEPDTYPAVLQRELDSGRRAARYQVLNAGVPGYTSYQGLLVLRERGLALRPDIVVIGFGYDEVTRAGDIETLLATTRSRLWRLRLDDTLAEWSGFYRWLRGRWAPVPPVDAPPRRTPEQYERDLRELVRTARAYGAKPVLLAFPAVLGREAYAGAEQRVADELDVPLIRYQGPRMDVLNPTAPGYQMVVTQLAERLDALGYTR